eukprot:jgi/Tetstr1/447935/TSEL_035241.t1
MAATSARPPSKPANGGSEEAETREPAVTQLSKLDVYVRQLRLLTRAEYPSDTLERMLAANRLLLCFLTDILRPSGHFKDTPHVLVGAHYLSQREIGPSKPFNGWLRGYIQEICSFNAHVTPFHGREEEGTKIAQMALKLYPKAVAKHKGAVKGKGPHMEVSLDGHANIVFPFHEEEYDATSFPKLILEDPLSLTCTPDFIGEINIRCQASGLFSKMTFKPGQRVEGYVENLLGQSTQRQCQFAGRWDDTVTVSCPAMSLGPQQLPRLWTPIMDAVLYSDRTLATSKAAQELADNLAVNVVFALDPRTSASARRMQMVRNAARADKQAETAPSSKSSKAGSKSARSAGDSDSEKAGSDSDEDEGGTYEENKYDDDPRSLPPCIKEQRALGRAMHYEMHYNLRVLRPEEEVPAPPDDATDDSHAPSSSATTPPAAPGSSSGASTSSAQSQPTRVSP